VNTALVAPPLERASAETRADILSMVYNVNSRPIANVWLNAKYRYYDYANKTPHFEGTAVIGDWNVSSNHIETEPASFKRQNLDLDASFTPLRYLGIGVGYGRENADRTFRIYEKTAEDIVRVSADSTGNKYVTFRTKYEFSRREGSHFEQHLLDEVGEQPTMRHFDIANRDRYRVTGQVTVMPVERVSFNASIGNGRDDYKDTGFGLRDNKNTVYLVGVDVVPVDTVAVGASYGYDKYTALQRSHSSNPPTNAAGLAQWTDPTRDWSIDQNDKVHTVAAYLDLLETIPKTDIRLSFDLSDAKAAYVYNLAPNQSIFTSTPLAQIAPLENTLTTFRLDVLRYVRSNVALGGYYHFENYEVFDFTLNDTTINQLNLPSTIYTGYLYSPYKAHTFALRMSYLW
jgi:hypothetical protein